MYLSNPSYFQIKILNFMLHISSNSLDTKSYVNNIHDNTINSMSWSDKIDPLLAMSWSYEWCGSSIQHGPSSAAHLVSLSRAVGWFTFQWSAEASRFLQDFAGFSSVMSNRCPIRSVLTFEKEFPVTKFLWNSESCGSLMNYQWWRQEKHDLLELILKTISNSYSKRIWQLNGVCRCWNLPVRSHFCSSSSSWPRLTSSILIHDKTTFSNVKFLFLAS